jgi:hypothetical protein
MSLAVQTSRRRAPLLVVLTGILVGVHAALFLTMVRHAARLEPPSRSTAMAHLYHDVAHTVGPGADFFALYHAGVSASRGRSVYEPGENPATTPYYYSYRYLPITAHTMGRLAALLPPAAALLLWMSIVELVLAAFAVAVWRALGTTFNGLAGVAILLLSAPYWLELYMGQFTFVATTLTAIATLTYVTGRRHSSMIGMLAAISTKVFPAVALPAFFRSREGRAGVATVLGVVVVLNLPFFWLDCLAPDAFWGKNFVGEAAGLDAGNHGALFVVYQLGEMVAGPWHLPTWGRLTVFWRVLVLGGTAALVVRTRRARLEPAVAVLLLAHFVSYFQVWEHHMSGAAVAGLLLSIGLDRSGRVLERRVALATTAVVALPTPFVLFGSDVAGTALERLLTALSKAGPLLLLYVVGLATMVQPARGSPGSSR